MAFLNFTYIINFNCFIGFLNLNYLNHFIFEFINCDLNFNGPIMIHILEIHLILMDQIRYFIYQIFIDFIEIINLIKIIIMHFRFFINSKYFIDFFIDFINFN